MTEKSTKETIRNQTIHTLVRQVGLTPQEVAQLRLSHLHLAGKKPNLSFTPPGSAEPKTIDLNLDAHRALVGWLVARPDSAGDFLFPGQGDQPLAESEVQQLLENIEHPAPPPVEKPTPPKPSSTKQMPPAPGSSKPMPPPSAPELGAPPPGFGGRMSHFGPLPTSAPEAGEPVNMSLPTSSPKPPSRPPEPLPGASKPLRPEPRPVPGASGGLFPVERPAPGQVKSSTSRPMAQPVKKKILPTTQEIDTDGPSASRLPRLLGIGAAAAAIVACLACAGGGWFLWQSQGGEDILASLGLSNAAAERFPNEKEIMASLTPPAYSPLPTPTLPPTSTPTPLPLPTVANTPVPPTAVPVPPTDTPLPPPTVADTPVPVDTPTPIPTDTPAPVETATPTDTPTPGMQYPAPVLLEPKDGAEFIEGNIVVLRWQSVGELAPNEQYAVRLIYTFQNQTTYQGTNLRETEWTIPASLYKQIDGPENRYEWFVVVEKRNDDGSGTAISPESERRTFTWK